MNYHKELGCKSHIEKWLIQENIEHNTINEPNHAFHFILKNNLTGIEIFQEKKTSDVIVGIMIFLSNELNYKLYKFTQIEKEKFKIKVDDFLSTVRVDYRIGFSVNYELFNDNGHYGAKYFIKIKANLCDKEKLLKIIAQVMNTRIRSDEFLNSMLKNKTFNDIQIIPN